MKMKIFLTGLSAALTLAACNHSENRYLDLNTGEPIGVRKDTTTGFMVNETTGKPVAVYVDTRTRDTISGRTGTVVNGRLIKTSNGTWEVKGEDEELKAKSGDAKIKTEDDEKKVKDGSFTSKREGDGDVKIETGSKTIKVDGKTGERKVKKDHNITDKVKKVFH
ncbi:MAG TPA: hypothetical protein VNR87_11390 [Flavisolibacter sp.]|nr:hypothetical protein [Flavisolibacter sp.]